jgi:hypothetical protein
MTEEKKDKSKLEEYVKNYKFMFSNSEENTTPKHKKKIENLEKIDNLYLKNYFSPSSNNSKSNNSQKSDQNKKYQFDETSSKIEECKKLFEKKIEKEDNKKEISEDDKLLEEEENFIEDDESILSEENLYKDEKKKNLLKNNLKNNFIDDIVKYFKQKDNEKDIKTSLIKYQKHKDYVNNIIDTNIIMNKMYSNTNKYYNEMIDNEKPFFAKRSPSRKFGYLSSYAKRHCIKRYLKKHPLQQNCLRRKLQFVNKNLETKPKTPKSESKIVKKEENIKKIEKKIDQIDSTNNTHKKFDDLKNSIKNKQFEKNDKSISKQNLEKNNPKDIELYGINLPSFKKMDILSRIEKLKSDKLQNTVEKKNLSISNKDNMLTDYVQQLVQQDIPAINSMLKV